MRVSRNITEREHSVNQSVTLVQDEPINQWVEEFSQGICVSRNITEREREF